MITQLYRHIVEDDVNFNYFMAFATSPDPDMPDGTIVQRDTNGVPVGFFLRVAPFWGMMYDGDTLYRRGAFGGTADQYAGHVLSRRLFTPVKQSDLVVVEEFSAGVFDSAQMSGITTLDPGRYAVVRQRDRRVPPPGTT